MVGNWDKIILDLCGGTGSWSKPYRDAGYDVRIITLPDNDVRLYAPPDNVYGILAAPPCDEFSIAKHFHGKGNYTHNFEQGLEVLSACCRIILTCKPKFYAIENPANGMMKKWLGKPDVIIKFSMLKSKEIFPEYYGVYTRQERRAITPPGFAQAFFEANR